jgi:VCBS repeat-containing protein
MAHRYWTLSGPGLAFTSYAGTFTFLPGDLDVGADTAGFVVEQYAGGTWSPLAAGARTATSTQATGITPFGDFATGELASGALDHFVVTAPASATAGSPVNLSVTAVDAVGNVVTRYTGMVTFSSTDPYASFSPLVYTFVLADAGTHTFAGGATLNTAGTQTVSVAGSSKTGTSGSIAVGAGAFDRLLVIVPGETAVPGSPTGRAGVPITETANTAFTVTVMAVDAHWNAVSSSHVVAISSSDAAAVLPPNAALVAGSGSFSVTPQTGGATTVTATDVTDGTKAAGTSSPIPVTNTAPVVTDDAWSMVQDRTLTVAASGVLANDTDPQGQPIIVAAPRPFSGPAHGSLTLNADGSFSYTPVADYSGTDTFTYRATDGFLTSAAATVTITIASSAYTSSSNWGTSFSPSRYLAVDFPAYVAPGSVVAGATFTHTYRSATAGDTTCTYLEVYQGATLIGTHGSAGAPLSCNSTWSWTTDVVPLPEVNSVARANNVRIVLYVRNSGGGRSLHRLMTVGIDYSLR